MSFRIKFYDSIRCKPSSSVADNRVTFTSDTEVLSVGKQDDAGEAPVVTEVPNDRLTGDADDAECETVEEKPRSWCENDNKPNDSVYRDNRLSVGFPDGLAMDPLSPTAMAVSTEFMDRLGTGITLLKEHGKKVQKYVWKNRKFEILKKSWNSVVNVVLIEAKNLPDGPATGNNTVYCKFRLGSENHKSKTTAKSIRPAWRERFNLHLYEDNLLEVSVWHKNKQKNFMGRCVIDLSKLEKERTHDLWQPLECGFGEIHLSVTVSGTIRVAQNVSQQLALTNGIIQTHDTKEKYVWYNLSEWCEVGELSVTVHCAKGLSTLGLGGRADAFCVLELDNTRLQTHTVHGTSEPEWNKTYTLEIRDITSTLDLCVYDEAKFNNSMKGETLGKLTVPLLRINNGEKRWYALKDRTRRRSARGNCPRILLEMKVTWNPIKASLQVFRPKATKYVQKPAKFDIPLIYNNLVFIKAIFNAIQGANEELKRLFEWESQEKSAVALVVWLVFWLVFRPWMTPLLLLPPFVFHMLTPKGCNNNPFTNLDSVEEDGEEEDIAIHKDDKTIKTRIYSLQDLTLTIKNGIDYIVSTVERIKNLFNFTVPYLSYLAIAALIGLSLLLYIVPFRFVIMALGIYKFTRKFLSPDRVPNNDILDFISRLPDDELLKEWRELKVPEPSVQRAGSFRKNQ